MTDNELEEYKKTEKYRRLHTELGFNGQILGDPEKCICKDCKYRLKYKGPIEDTKYIEEYNYDSICKCVCEKFNDSMPRGLRNKPRGILANNETCDLYEKEN